MSEILFSSRTPVTIVGGGPVEGAEIAELMAIAPGLVAADGGAAAALKAGVMPQAVIGDYDSIDTVSRAAIPAARQHVINAQDSTDFDKVLAAVEAPLFLGLGFLGGRLDHELAVLSSLVQRAGKNVVLLGCEDLVFHHPAAAGALKLDLEPGTRFSLFPLRPVTGTSRGLHWPIDGLNLAPGGAIGTSNRVAGGPVELTFHNDGMLVILPRSCLAAVLTARGW
jgi:thiamine pyrophosphokinase